jgi:hypothetical protein
MVSTANVVMRGECFFDRDDLAFAMGALLGIFDLCPPGKGGQQITG